MFHIGQERDFFSSILNNKLLSEGTLPHPQFQLVYLWHDPIDLSQVESAGLTATDKMRSLKKCRHGLPMFQFDEVACLLVAIEYPACYKLYL